MTPESGSFKVSAGLKDIIGRGLITNDLVAVFELVKNSFDAHATSVELFFEPGQITITDNGKGMSREAIFNKWMFVAYSAKRDDTEDDDYRHKLHDGKRTFAGDKGIGRFSCDRLGTGLVLQSCAEPRDVQVVTVDWTRYEQSPKEEFGTVQFQISTTDKFSDEFRSPRGPTGTVLAITGLRHDWPRPKLLNLRRGLAKLINPFETGDPDFRISIIAPTEEAADQKKKKPTEIVNGPIENTLLDVLKEKTTSIRVVLSPSTDSIETTLEDRGDTIYRIREANPYQHLTGHRVRTDIYYLNRSAKATFHRRMGLRSVAFGSIFVFRDGFRMFPIGEEHDDFFGLSRRKQQGVRRYLGTRDVIGRVDVPGTRGFEDATSQGFEEATSRDQGLVRTPEVADLSRFVIEKAIHRLERYVVGITWKDPYDQEQTDTTRMALDESSLEIGKLVSRLSDTNGVEILHYNHDLVRVVDTESASLKASVEALDLLAARIGDDALRKQVTNARSQLKDLHQDATAARLEYEAERQRNRFLMAAQAQDGDTIVNLLHQILGHASDVQVGVRRMMRDLRRMPTEHSEKWLNFLEMVSFRTSQIVTSARFATKGGYKAEAMESRSDLVGYIEDYVEMVASVWAPQGIRVELERNGGPLERWYRPIDVGIVVDNLVSNAAKAKSSRIRFMLGSLADSSRLRIIVADDGRGWPAEMEPVARVFEKGTSTTNGSGLGLYHVRQVVEDMRGVIEAHPGSYSKELNGAQLTIEVRS